MSKTLHVLSLIVLVLLQLLINTDGSIPEAGTKCFRVGETVIYTCQFPALVGNFVWKGINFYCPNINTAANNVIPFHVVNCLEPIIDNGTCGPYFANLMCAGEGNVSSMLEFQANYEMNGGNIYCLFRGENKTFLVSVGVTPNPPLRVRVTIRQNGSCQFGWTPPNESIGGIRGYNIRYGDNCGNNCSPAAGFINQTEELTAECSECIGENNNICHFEVSTVSKDCSFDSPPVEATSDSPINSPMDITVSITCSLTPNPPPIYVEWIWQFSEESRREFSGFLITISDQFGHKVDDIQEDSKVRSKYFDSSVLKERDGFVGEIWNATVAIAFDEDRDTFAFDSIQFSVEDTIMIDPSSAVTPDQCIEVSINNHCNERSDTFQAQVQFIEGTCGSNSELTNTGKYTLQDYKTCVPVVAGTICYSTVIFHNELELGRTERQNLILLPCILKTSNSTRVKINSTNGPIPLGIEVTVPHNTRLYFFCGDPNCTLISNGYNETRCANGTFQPAVTQDGCRCPGDLPIPLWSIFFIGISGLVVVIDFGCVLCCCYKYCHCRKGHRKDELTLQHESDNNSDY